MKIRVASNGCAHESFWAPLTKKIVVVVYYVYILKSVEANRFYIGYSEFPERRLLKHNVGKVKSTRPFRPWNKVYDECFQTEVEAIRRSKKSNQKSSRSYLEWLISKRAFGQTRPDENLEW
jgi:putative endonuclease